MIDYQIEEPEIKEKFLAWLRDQGAEVLAPTNPYELVRFRARSAVHVIYSGRRGITAGRFAEKCFHAFTTFKKNRPFDMGIKKKPRTTTAKTRAALFERDGRKCFFCLRDMSDSDMTIEHLVAVGKGGPSHLDNLALAHEKCNREAGNKTLREKIGIRMDAALSKAEEELGI